MTRVEFLKTPFIRFEIRGPVCVRQEYWKRIDSDDGWRKETVGEWRDAPAPKEQMTCPV